MLDCSAWSLAPKNHETLIQRAGRFRSLSFRVTDYTSRTGSKSIVSPTQRRKGREFARRLYGGAQTRPGWPRFEGMMSESRHMDPDFGKNRTVWPLSHWIAFRSHRKLGRGYGKEFPRGKRDIHRQACGLQDGKWASYSGPV